VKREILRHSGWWTCNGACPPETIFRRRGK